MMYRDEAQGLRVHFGAQHHELSAAETEKMQDDLQSLARIVDDFPVAHLHVDIVRHPRRHDFHVKTSLRLPKCVLFTGERHAKLHPAYERCVRKLVNKVKGYKEKLRQKPERERAQHGAIRELWPDREPDLAALEAAARDGDYLAFRQAMRPYDDSLDHHLGRWVKRYPQIEARLGQDLVIADLVEEVYLNAFEGLAGRPAGRMGNWLESLIDPSLRALLLNAEDERENLSFVGEIQPG